MSKKVENKAQSKKTVRAVMDVVAGQFTKPPQKSDIEKKITLTELELAIFVSAIRAEETGCDSMTAANAAKEMLKTTTKEGEGKELLAFLEERAERHTMLGRIMKQALKPELAKYLHGNPQSEIK